MKPLFRHKPECMCHLCAERKAYLEAKKSDWTPQERDWIRELRRPYTIYLKDLV